MSTSIEAGRPQPAWYRRPFWVALFGSLLLFVAQPPLGWSYVAWVAPLPWLYLATAEQLEGRRPYLRIWLAGACYWLAALHWIRLAHPATIFGLLLLAGYLGVYLPLFVRTVRLGHLQLGLPLWLVAPSAWVAIEWLEAHVLGGFLMGALGHTQIQHLHLVQIADLAGAYLVSALVMLVASCLWEVWLWRSHRRTARLAAALAIGCAALAGTGWYGESRLQDFELREPVATQRLALVQASERAVWTADPDRDSRVMGRYIALTEEARTLAEQQGRPIDLLVWPEGAFRTPIYSYDAALQRAELERAAEVALIDLSRLSELAGAPLLVGLERVHIHDLQSFGRLYNAAAAVDAGGNLIGTYDKTHLVMFGEYVPGGTWWPEIYRYFPIGGVTPGAEPRAFDVGGIRYMPTICYETVIPHVVRRQVAVLAAAGERPDVLVNVTNDSWFYDSSELAMHLACSRLRAIECRTPLVAAANGGLSANVDVCGRLLDVSQPMTEQVLLVDVAPGGSETLYLRLGDTFAIACLVGSVVVLTAALIRTRKAETSNP